MTGGGAAQPLPRPAALPFAATAAGAVIVAGAAAAAAAHAPTQPVVWAIAYLTLVVGVAQYLLGVGWVRLAARPPHGTLLWGQWLVLNAGHAAVVGGTLARNGAVVTAGVMLYALAMAGFVVGVRGATRSRWRAAYLVFAIFMLASSLVGIALSVARHGL